MKPPIFIFEDHHEAFKYWDKNELRDCTLIHIDAHPDMVDEVSYQERLTSEYWTELSVADFIAPAVHYGIISSIYWINPHSQSKEVQDLGTVRGERGRQKLKTIVDNGKIFWKSTEGYYRDEVEQGNGKVVSIKEIKDFYGPLILDIDLDAFCCGKPNTIYNTSKGYNGIHGWEKRVKKLSAYLQHVKRPDLITIAKSSNAGSFVPLDLVGNVERGVMKSLNDLLI